MRQPNEDDTDLLVEQAAAGDLAAGEALLERHSARLRKMIAVRMDQRLAARVDPSDVVQDAMAVAHRRLPDFLRDRPVPFYAWLRQIAWDRLVDLHRRHVRARRRSVDRELPGNWGLPGESAMILAQQASTPSQHLLREELQRRVTEAMNQMPSEQREILIMRHLEELSVKEVAAILHIPEGTVKSRHFRALECVRNILAASEGEP